MKTESHNTTENDTEQPAFRLRKLAPDYSENMPERFKGAAEEIRSGKRKKKRAASASLLRFKRISAWLIFLALGGAMAAMRYGGWLDMEAELKAYGPYIVLGLHVLVVLLAFSEDLFMGFLCLVVPGFSLYYLLARSGQAFLCAIVCGLLVGLGEDSWYALREFSLDLHETVSGMLAGDRK